MQIEPNREGLGETKEYLMKMMMKGVREGLLFQKYENEEPYYVSLLRNIYNNLKLRYIFWVLTMYDELKLK